MNIALLVFYAFSAILLGAATMVITSSNPVRGVLFLVLAMFCSAALWMLLQAEFLALVLIFVYVGAVMTLFLFVVMMLNINLVPVREGFVRYLPFGVLVLALLVGLMLMVISPKHFAMSQYVAVMHKANYSNVKELGAVLYTQYLFPFEIAAVLLLIAIVSAISLAFRGRLGGSLKQKIADQVAVKKEDRIRIVNLKANKS